MLKSSLYKIETPVGVIRIKVRRVVRSYPDSPGVSDIVFRATALKRFSVNATTELKAFKRILKMI